MNTRSRLRATCTLLCLALPACRGEVAAEASSGSGEIEARATGGRALAAAVGSQGAGLPSAQTVFGFVIEAWQKDFPYPLHVPPRRKRETEGAGAPLVARKPADRDEPALRARVAGIRVRVR